MIRDEFENICWRYYKLLEKSFVDILLYVELDKRNYSRNTESRKIQGFFL